jgi:hypothetical protein
MGKLRLYTQKTGTHVHCPLPEFVVKELEAIPKMSERYWFWAGNGKLQTATGDWQGHLLDLFQRMKVKQFARINKSTVDEARKRLEKKAASSRRVTRIVFATRSLSNFCWLVYRLNGFRFCSATPA